MMDGRGEGTDEDADREMRRSGRHEDTLERG